MTVGYCSICGERIQTRKPQNFIKKMGDHFRKEHPQAYSRRISQGIKQSKEMPDLQPFMDALNGDPETALSIYGRWTEKQYQDTKRVVRALAPFLPKDVVAGWFFIEAVHDRLKR